MLSTHTVAKSREGQHEIIGLVGEKLCMNYENWDRFSGQHRSDNPCLVVSFLGDTAVGKSTLIRELIGPGENDRPYVQRSTEQHASTTFNVNLYPCGTVLPGMVVNFLDFEGESGSAMPIMGASAARADVGSSFGGGGVFSMGGGILTSSSSASNQTGGGSGGAGASSLGKSASVLGGDGGSSTVVTSRSGGQHFASLTASLLRPALVTVQSQQQQRPPVGGAGGGGGFFGFMTSSSTSSSGAMSAMTPLPLVGGGVEAIPLASTSILDRARLVRENFPRLAYCASDLVVLTGTDELFSSRYLERALSFAKAANSNILDVELPVLIIINNKIDVDRCEVNMEKTTRGFQERMGRDLSQLENYFSCIVVCQLPNIKTVTVNDDGTVLSGVDLFASQISKIRTLLASLLNARLQEREEKCLRSAGGGPGRRVITSRAGLWFTLLPRMVARLNTGEPVHVGRLVDEAWSASLNAALGGKRGGQGGGGRGGEAPMDIFKAFITHLRPPTKGGSSVASLSSSSPSSRAPFTEEEILGRFVTFQTLVVDIAVRLIAARLRHVHPSLLFQDKVDAVARTQLEATLTLLDDIMPCRAIYGEAHKGASIELGIPLERPAEPILCLQERRVHSKGHRGTRCVRGGGPSIWQRLLSVHPYNPTWSGDYVPASQVNFDMDALLEEVLEAVRATPAEFYGTMLADLQHSHSSSSVALQLVPFNPVPPSTSALPYQISDKIHPDAASMHYCIGCGHRCADKLSYSSSSSGSVKGGESTESSESSSSASLSSSSAPSAAAATPWSSLFIDILSLATVEAKNLIGVSSASASASAASNTSSNVSEASVTGAKRTGGLKKVSSNASSSPSALSNFQQIIPLRICDECIVKASS